MVERSSSDAARGKGGRPRKSPRFHDARLFYRGRWVAADLRPWGLGRITLRDPDHRHWPKGGDRTDSISIAETWLPAYLEHVHRIHKRQRIVPRRLKAALLEFHRHRETTVEKNTQGGDRTTANHLIAYFQDAPVRDVGDRLQAFFDHLARRGYLASTLHCYARSVHAFFAWADIEHAELRLPDVPETDARFWTDAELVRIRKGADYVGPFARLMLELVLGTGARQQELFAIDWPRFDERTRSLRIVDQLERDRVVRKPLKGKRARSALVLPAFWRYIDEHVSDWRTRIGPVLAGREGGLYYRKGQRTLMGRVLDAAHLREPGVGYHTGRHTYGRLVLEAGASLEQLRVFLGHKHISTTDQIYGHLTEAAALRLAREKVFGTS